MSKLDEVLEVIRTKEHGDILLSDCEYIGHGYAHTVYKINEDKVIKVSNGKHTANPSIVLKELSGLPFIPELFEAHENDEWHITQYVDGYDIVTLLPFRYTPPLYMKVELRRRYRHVVKNFDNDAFLGEVTKFFKQCLEKSWIPNDLHAENVMLDGQGKLWIIDIDQFEYFSPRKILDDIGLVKEEHIGSYIKTLLNQQSSRNPRSKPFKTLINYGKELNEMYIESFEVPTKWGSFPVDDLLDRAGQ
ncbi:hypothetical protein [Salinicoccus roseus]|uniref:hypothetical protein n=1 Tax=Salinicoccus roseus TaxID=45670 RepID=UPI003568D3B3